MMYQLKGYEYASSNALGIVIPPIIRTLVILQVYPFPRHVSYIYIYIYIYIFIYIYNTLYTTYFIIYKIILINLNIICN